MNGHMEEEVNGSIDLAFDQFVNAVTCKSILTSFHQLLDLTGLRHEDHAHFYEKLKQKLKGSWKAQNLWAKLDKRASHRDYKKGQACKDIKVLIIGSGPCGLRAAIECALLGAKTVIVEKRDRFSRNNVLHLWPYLITDLRNLGAKKFFGKFCAGAIDHISIRQLQCILLKVALLLGVEVHVNVAFEELIEPPEDQSSGMGWRCRVSPSDHAVSEYEVDVVIGADGKRNTLPGFRRKEFRGKLAIAITANFINRNTQAEARVEEISGVAFIFNQKFFLDLKESTRIDLENIVYYKDDTHYFVMTAKKASLLEKGVLKEDYSDTVALLDRSNVNQDALLAYAREAANFSTNYQLPSLDYAVNHYGQADVAMFDFTSMFAAENASRFLLKNGHHLLLGLVGDTLLEPFWPTGSGCARGFLGAFDAAWMVRSWALGRTPLQVLAERESIYTVLSQTTPNYLHKNHSAYSLDPNTRYPNLNLKVVKPSQVKHLYEGGVFDEKELEEEDLAQIVPAKKARNVEQSIDSYRLLRWCQRVLNTDKYRNVHVVDFTSSWRSGLALCALIHSFRPGLINTTMLMECDVAANNQLAFNVAEKELGIPPVMTGEDMAKYEVPDKLTMVSYLSQFFDLFKYEPLPSSMPLPVKPKRKSTSRDAKQPKSPRSPNKRTSFLQKISSRLAKSKKRKDQEENEGSPLVGSKKLKEKQEKGEVELMRYSKLPMEEIANRLQLDRRTDIKVSKTEEMSGAVSVTAMADLLVAKFKSYESQPPPEPVRKLKGQPTLLAASSASEFCSFCHKRVYIMERMSAEGEFFHRGCLKCDHCSVGLRLNNYSCDRDSKPVKFYCYRHALPEMRLRAQRKRGLEEDVKENVPDVVISPVVEEDTGQASKQKSPRKTAPQQLSALVLPKDVQERPKKTPERVEFEISFDGQEEESEEEQFEHNLRASLSSDTLLDDEDSDSDLSDSDMESGAEDEVWENAVESLKSPHAPLTLEEACELRGSWRRQHSQENLVEAVEENRNVSHRPVYTRLRAAEGEEEGSSTEVDEGSEYETDGSSSEEDSDEDKTEPARTGSNDASLKSPVSPVSKLSASKASFFSEPPTVVSLDPWSMFGMGNKGKGKKGHPSNVPVAERKGSSASDRKKSSSSESKSVSKRKKSTDSKKDASSKDTDISESLEFDVKSADVFEDKNENLSGAGSLDELKDELFSEIVESEGRKERTESVSSVEVVDISEKSRPHSILKKKSVESLIVSDSDHLRDTEKGSEGDDEGMIDDDDDDELLEKTAVSHAMEQLLHDIDHRSFSKDSSGENLLNNSSDSAENAYIEGRLSPSANKTRKFRMKRHARRSKERCKSHSVTSDSEAGRTTTDNSQLRSSMSRSPSAEVEEPEHKTAIEPSNDPEHQDSEVHQKKPVLGESGSLTAETGTGDDTLRHVLENLAVVGNLSDNSDIDEIVLQNVDDRFVTDRRKKNASKTGLKLIKKPRDKPAEVEVSSKKQEDAEMNSSFSISTPSDSESSVSSLEGDEFAGEIPELELGDDDAKPDQDMLKDYTTTMSLALGESYSDDADEETEDKATGQDKKTVIKPTVERNIAVPEADLADDEDVCSNNRIEENLSSNDNETTANSSIFITPDASLENQDSAVKTPSPKSGPSRRPLPIPRSQAPVPQARKSLHSPTANKKIPKDSSQTNAPNVSLDTPIRGDNRDSSGSEIFLSPVESFPESPLVNKSQISQPSSVKLSSDQSPAVTATSPQNNATTNISSSAKSSATTVIKSHRKLPELPKLKVGGSSNVDPPIMCSSPKVSNKVTPKTSTSDLKQQNRVLPVPKTSNENKKNNVNTSSTSSNTNKPVTNASQRNVFTKPASPSEGKSLSKTKVPLDRNRLKLGSSSDRQESDQEADKKKKISAEGIVINPGEDDIPFADESETDEKFYTPIASEKRERPKFPAKHSSIDAQRKILPSPPTVTKSDPAVLSAEQIREIRKADMEKAKFQARERARLKSDEELGLADANSGGLVRIPLKTVGDGVTEIHHMHTISLDTQSTSDILSESDDNRLSSVQTATSSATEGDHLAQPKSSANKKKKAKKAKKGKDKKDAKDKEPESKERKKSLLALILPAKTPDKGTKESNYDPNSDNTPKTSDDISKTKNKTKKTKLPKIKIASCEDLDKTPTSETKKDLAICSVFHSEASNRQAQNQLGVTRTRKTPAAPKASVDDLSDSDESHISLSTMQKRQEEDLDERVARRLRKIQQKQQKQAEQKRLRMAQEIQRQLEEVEVKQKELEERGITVEKALRGDGPEEDVDESQLMSEWFTLVHEKNALLRYESELNVRAKELELEDRQARLEVDFRERSRQPARAGQPDLKHRKTKNNGKTESDIAVEGNLLDELLNVVEQRNNLVAMLEEDRLREQKEDNDLKEMMAEKGFVLSPLSFDTRRERQKIEAPLASPVL